LFAFVLFETFEQMTSPLSSLNDKINLQLSSLPTYLARTCARLLIALVLSVIIAVIYAAVAAKNKRIGALLIPLIDIFQSIPVLGFLSFTVAFFISLEPDNVFGIEMAIIFAIITTQVWNMIFSVYQSLISIPKDLYAVATIYKLNKWKTFWRLELPYAIPGLIWNIMLSMSASWFFIVAQEVINIGSKHYIMPGMGGYIALALKEMDLSALCYGTLAITVAIVIFNIIIFKPLICWSDKFRYEFNIGANNIGHAWFLNCLNKANLVQSAFAPLKILLNKILNIKLPKIISNYNNLLKKIFEAIWWLFIVWALINLAIISYNICNNHLTIADVLLTFKLATITALRITALLILSSLIWVPIGIYIGLRPKLSNAIQPVCQFLLSIPANIYYPIFVISIVKFHLNPDIWLSLVIVIGCQWYIVYNVIGGTQTIPSELLEAAKIFRLKLFTRLTKILLPAIVPHYVTGLITAAGGSWNASIVAEIISYGHTTLVAQGLGSYITINANAGNFPKITLGIMMMIVFVLLIDHFIWKPLQKIASTRFNLD
jgi:NitT/TauT family transport system permease protein